MTARVIAGVAGVALLCVAIWRLRTGRPGRAALAFSGAVLLALFAADQRVLPDGEGAAENAADALGGWLYPFIAGMAFLETAIPPLTLVFPGEFGVLLGGAIAGVGRADIVLLVAITWVCSVLGDSVTFALGRRLGRPFLVRYGRPIGLTDARLERLDGWFDRFGPPTVAFGRLLPLARPFGPFVTGASEFPYRRFLAWNALGCLLFALVFCLVGYTFARSYDEAVRTIARGGFSVLAVIAALAAGVYLLRRRRRRRARLALEEAAP